MIRCYFHPTANPAKVALSLVRALFPSNYLPAA
jgi:hypothetical protein